MANATMRAYVVCCWDPTDPAKAKSSAAPSTAEVRQQHPTPPYVDKTDPDPAAALVLSRPTG